MVTIGKFNHPEVLTACAFRSKGKIGRPLTTLCIKRAGQCGLGGAHGLAEAGCAAVSVRCGLTRAPGANRDRAGACIGQLFGISRGRPCPSIAT